MGFVSKLLSLGSDKDLKRFMKIKDKVNALGPKYEAMESGSFETDAQGNLVRDEAGHPHAPEDTLRGQTEVLRGRLAAGESLDDILPDAFAVVREAASRTVGMRHFDVQILGGIALHEGMIAEMKTGEGKTLVATLPAYLNALAGKGVHVVTVNDYLAKRDSEWMGRVYRFLGMEVGLLQNGMALSLKRPAYAADITYGTNSEFGFDYLRDNMVTRPEQRVQRGHFYAIVDEVDSILIDEARTPLIISGAGTQSADTYRKFARAVRGLKRAEEPEFDMLSMGEDVPEPDGDFVMDEAKHTIAATEQGLKKIENRLGIDDIYADLSGQLVNHLQQALKAEYMFHRDQQYVVTPDREVKIVDEFTGRIMEGRRYSEGLHQAIEAKENVPVREENQTLATITLQNYFRLYDKLAGMTGTALTEDAEFREIYNLPVQVIPPNRPNQRADDEDEVYRTIDAKYNAVADRIQECHAKGQPVLVGTVSIESSERLSRMLSKRGIAHEVLNAKYHEREAHIVAQAGRLGAVTIATNMAGRGTDILLGGNPEELAREDVVQRDFGLPRAELERILQEGDPAKLTHADLVEMGVSDEVEQSTLNAIAQAKEEAEKRYREQCRAEHEQVVEAGGLMVIGTERHESRRIDNQLRGRSGRQGDPGETQFYLSLEDDLMRLFGGDRMDKISDMMLKADMPDDMPIQSKLISKAVENAQRKVEGINFGMRKNVLEYDDVMNKQRQVIYEERNRILDGKDLSDHVQEVMRDTVSRCVGEFCPQDKGAAHDVEGLRGWLADLTGRTDVPVFSADASHDDLVSQALAYVQKAYNEKAEALGDELMTTLNTQVMLRVIDTRWMTYLQEMDYLKQGIGLRGFGQRDPLVEYKSEAYRAFQLLVSTMYEDYLRTVLRIEVRRAAPQVERQQAPSPLAGATYSGPSEVDGAHAPSALARNAAVQATDRAVGAAPQGAAGAAGAGKVKTYVKAESGDPYANVGRNDPCPCGSGKKFKNCHGRNR